MFSFQEATLKRNRISNGQQNTVDGEVGSNNTSSRGSAYIFFKYEGIRFKNSLKN